MWKDKTWFDKVKKTGILDNCPLKECNGKVRTKKDKIGNLYTCTKNNCSFQYGIPNELMHAN